MSAITAKMSGRIGREPRRALRAEHKVVVDDTNRPEVTTKKSRKHANTAAIAAWKAAFPNAAEISVV